ncbi:MAG: FAD-dependent oxidoreductase [Acidobacteriota bacterium]|nr:FAD-dependent oxidoreductase [Acidobacteriota bacterium]MDE3043235.1 FAD-dependent oxidoreductase [Acidobacteriota bacterium]MDE3106557.1 FAD-dependent oxidoreductase [Acidobacteriota bacterium]MDE3222206.1 FAD-dependent oxidoreductase [Acidobacteriota bacterium]
MRVAVVGAGVSGLTAAYLLAPHHEVTLFEAQDRLGGHAHTVRVDGGDQDYDVDTGFLVYNDATYPLFIKLLDKLGVTSQESEMSFSYADAATGLEWKGTTLNTIFAQRRNLLRPRFLRMLWHILSFNRSLRRLVASDLSSTVTMGELLATRPWSREFRDWYLVPMGAAIWSANPEKFLEMPARTFAEFFERHGLLSVRNRPQWRTIVGGSRRYVEAMEKSILDHGSVVTSAPVREVRRDVDGVSVVTDHESSRFDHVIMACHSDEALALLRDPSDDERRLLGAIRYQENSVTLHWDEALLPRSRRAWAAWNYRRRDEITSLATLTYNVSTLQSIPSRRQFLVTLNDDDAIDEAKVLERFRYAHPVLDAQTVDAQSRRALLQSERTSYCGAYLGYGFHEDGVRSAFEACVRLGISW